MRSSTTPLEWGVVIVCSLIIIAGISYKALRQPIIPELHLEAGVHYHCGVCESDFTMREMKKEPNFNDPEHIICYCPYCFGIMMGWVYANETI